MRKENEKSLECRIGTTDTNNHIFSWLDSDAVSSQAAHSALAYRTGDIGNTQANFGIWARSMRRKQTL